VYDVWEKYELDEKFARKNLKVKEQLRDQKVEGIIIFKGIIKIKC
jgi:hypothetical protein